MFKWAVGGHSNYLTTSTEWALINLNRMVADLMSHLIESTCWATRSHFSKWVIERGKTAERLGSHIKISTTNELC